MELFHRLSWFYSARVGKALLPLVIVLIHGTPSIWLISETCPGVIWAGISVGVARLGQYADRNSGFCPFVGAGAKHASHYRSVTDRGHRPSHTYSGRPQASRRASPLRPSRAKGAARLTFGQSPKGHKGARRAITMESPKGQSPLLRAFIRAEGPFGREAVEPNQLPAIDVALC